MKRIGMFVLMCAMAFGLCVATAKTSSARPPYKPLLDGATAKSKAAEEIKKTGCAVCHTKVEKKDRNEFGKAMNKHITKDDFMKLKSDKDALGKKFEEALKAALKEKNKGGKNFQEMIDAGKLPTEVVEKL